MNCETALVLIYDLVDGEILPKDEILLKEHLAICQHCQTTLKSIEKAEKIYKHEILVTPAPDSVNTITKQVLENKNVFSLQSKKPYWSTKRIVYYLGTMAASFAAFIYLAGSLIIVNLASKIDLTSAISNTSSSNFNLDMSFSQFIESDLLNLLSTITNNISQSTLLKDLAIILFLVSLQFTISYLFTQNKIKQDNKL
ncbi:MAG: zf-HC2 domain-containing protein [Acidobacteria bacterium]|nr:zf-HC2 domain-containing protein [Acidobacteriota bacterium]